MFIRKKILVLNLALVLFIALSGDVNSATSFKAKNSPSINSNYQTQQLAFRRGGGGSRAGSSFRSNDFSSRSRPSSGYMTHSNNYNPPKFQTNQTRDNHISRDGGYMIPGNDSIHRNQVRNNNQININNNRINVNNRNNRVVVDPNRITHVNPNRYPYNYPNWRPYHHHDGDYWRGFWHGYNYRYPYGVALTTALVTIPLTAIAVSAASQPEVNYYYNQGVYYSQTPNGYVVSEPPLGVVVQSLPDGMLPVTVDNNKYYYYFGSFYIKNPQGSFEVVNAPCGATVPYIPDGFNELQIDGKTVLQAFNTYYLAGKDGDNTIFTVVDPNYI